MRSIDDLNCAIMRKQQIVQLTPHDHLDRTMYLDNLNNSLQKRFERTESMDDIERTESMDDIDRVIRTNEQIIESTSNNHLYHARRLNNLGTALLTRFKWM